MKNEIEKKNLKRDWLFYGIVCVVSLLIGYLSLGKNFDFDTYASLQGDGTGSCMAIKSIQENGIAGIWFNPRIGAPETSALIDFPGQDILMTIMIWCISLFITSTAKIMYVYLILTFVLNALSMALLLRKINIKYMPTFVISILFTAAPYHFFRYLGHLGLGNYMSFAITIYLSLNILGIINEEKKDRWKICICAILLGLGYGYYYAFGLILMTVAYIMKFIKSENKKEIFGKGWIVGTVLGAIFLSALPQVIYNAINGSNPIAGQRSPIEQEIYGLKIIQLLLPPSYSRFPLFRNINQLYSSKAPLVNENSYSCMGLIASIGFIVLCIALVISFCAKKKKDEDSMVLIDFLSLSTLCLILMGSIGGFGEIFNALVTAQIRCYNRSSIYIMGLSLIMIALLLNQIKFKKVWISYVICGVTLSVGMVDQINICSDNWQEPIKNTQEVYEDFFAEVENQLDENAMVYQLPYLDYPEVSQTFDYKHFVGYLFTDTIRWSYGGVKGRNTEAGELNIDKGMSYRFLRNIKDAGFDAVYIDLAGYDDGGSRVLNFYNGIGLEPIVSDDGMLYLYDISEMEISDRYLIPGYGFVDSWDSAYGMNLGENEKADLANKMEKVDTSAYSTLWSGIKDRDIVKTYSDEAYVDFLYTSILGRTESDEERQDWVANLQNGTNREEAFYSFLNSSEFRAGQEFETTE